MALVTGAIGSIGPKLLELLKDEYKLQKGLRKQVKFLSDELESVHAALRKVAETPWDKLDEQVKIWARQVREASYDMEDILNTFLVRVQDHGPAKKGRLKRALKNLGELFSKGKARHEIGGAIEDIKKQLQQIADRRSRCKVDEIVAKPVEIISTVDPRLAAMFKEVEQLVGIDKSRDDIISMLQVDENVMKIVSIVGVGGLGKTTLAKASFDKLKSLYENTAFVSVGRNPNFGTVFKDILFYLDKIKYKDIHNTGRGVDLLIRELQEFLHNKRYFIVIDDVWDITSWQIIKMALVQKNSGSRVIITTRNREVAYEEEVYKLDPLSYDDSKRLFYIRLFGGEAKCPASHPAEASEKILKKCGGIPLAIITMASLLVGKSTEDWFDVCNSPGFYHGKGNQQVDDTEWILYLSYYDLPSYLRTCLLYLSVYPEDCEIDKDSLIWKWIAEGFVEKERGTRLFERGEEYFNQLVNRSMIQAVESDIYMGLVKSCRVHDMVLDLIRDLSCKENFVTTSNDDEGTSSSRVRVRRLAHQNRMMKESQEDHHMSMEHVRSLFAWSCDISGWVLPPSFELLRVLALEGCKSEKGSWQGLKNLGKLIHLRYLGLRGTKITELPKEVGALKQLQTLDVKGNIIDKPPSSISMLTQLLCLRCFWGSMPDGFLKKLTSLEELHISLYFRNYEFKQQFSKEVGNLREVRMLVVFNLWALTDEGLHGSLESDLLRSLGKLKKLQHLRLADTLQYEASTTEWGTAKLPLHLQHLSVEGIWFPLLPSSMNPEHLPNLTHLRLNVGHMDEAGLRALGGLPELCHLDLSTHMRQPSMASTATVAAHGCFFQKLRSCKLRGFMAQLELNEGSSISFSFTIWNGENQMAFGSRTKDESSRCSAVLPAVMPNLQELVFADVPVRALYKDGNGSCANLGLEYITSLHKVRVVVDCAGASADDVEKAEAELRHAAELHPNRPILGITLRNRPREPRGT